MKIHSIYYSKKQEKEFECVIHVENKTITKITSNDSVDFENEIEELQPSILGTKHFSLWKNRYNDYPFCLIYKSELGQKILYLNHSKLSFLIIKQRLKIKNSYYITSFIVYSLIGLIGIFLNILTGEFILTELEGFIYVWCIFAFFIMWNLNSKIEIKEHRINELKKKYRNDIYEISSLKNTVKFYKSKIKKKNKKIATLKSKLS